MYTLSKSPKVNASCFHKEKYEYVGRHVATSIAILSLAHHVEGRHKSSKIYLLLKVNCIEPWGKRGVAFWTCTH